MVMELERAVVIAVDDTPDSEVAFDFYVRHLHRPRNRVTVLHVVKPFIVSTNEMILPKSNTREEALAAQKQSIKNIEQTYRARMKKNAIPGSLSIVRFCKKPGKIICETVSEVRCSFLVIGFGMPTEGSLRHSNGLGSVGDYVLKHAKCPVVVVQSKPKSKSPKKTTVWSTSDSCSVCSETSLQRSNSCPVSSTRVRESPLPETESRDTVETLPRPVSQTSLQSSHFNPSRMFSHDQSRRLSIKPEEDEIEIMV